MEKMEYEKSLETYNKLKKYLISTCIKIEENFKKLYYPENENIANIYNDMYKLQNKNEEGDKLKTEILKKINEYKIKTKELQNKIDLIDKSNKITELEGKLKIKKNYLNQLKLENNSLNNIKSILNKGVDENNNL